MDVSVIWEKLHEQQVAARNLRLYETFDKRFLIDLIGYLEDYNETLLSYTNLPSQTKLILNNKSISKNSELSPIQRALLYNVTAIIRLKEVIEQLISNANCMKKGCSIVNPSTIITHLPKTSIANQFAADRMKRYGVYITELQINHPDIFRFKNLIIKQAKNQLAFNIFYSIRALFPNLFTHQALSNELKGILKNILKKAERETEDRLKFRNLFSYLKQQIKDTGFNSMLKLIQLLHLDKYVAKEFANFMMRKTDEVNVQKLEIQAVELSDLHYSYGLIMPQDFYSKHVYSIKTKRFKEVTSILNTLEKLDFNLVENKEKLKDHLNHILLLTPFESTFRERLKDERKTDKNNLFNQMTIAPIINKLLNIIDCDHTAPEHIKASLLAIKTKLIYNHNLALDEALDICQKITHKTKLSQLFPNNKALFSGIDDLCSTIKAHTKKNAFGVKTFNSIAKHAASQRRQLLYLVRDRVNISLNTPPVPQAYRWDEFLTHETKAPLSPDNMWWNGFFIFTPLGNNPRFPAHLNDQLASLEKLHNLRNCIDHLVLNNYKTLDELDATEITPNKIVGTVHLKELSKKLYKKEVALNSYILYLQLKAIQTILKRDLSDQLAAQPHDDSCYYLSLKKSVEKIESWCVFIKKQSDSYASATNTTKPPIFPNSTSFNSLMDDIKQLYSHDKKCGKSLSILERDRILENLKRLNQYQNGSVEEHQASYQSKVREASSMHDINILRKVVVGILEFHNHRVQHGFAHSFAKLFSDNKFCAVELQNINKKTKTPVRFINYTTATAKEQKPSIQKSTAVQVTSKEKLIRLPVRH